MSGIGPGDVVVCVDAGQCPCFTNTTRVRKGAVYRVLDKKMCRTLAGHDVPGVRLDRDNPIKDGKEGYSSSRRFRKLNDEPDQQEIVTRIKRCRPVKAREDA